MVLNSFVKVYKMIRYLITWQELTSGKMKMCQLNFKDNFAYW